MDLLNIPSMEMLQRSHKEWVEETLRIGRSTRDGKWSESIAVGSKGLAAMVKKQRGIRAKGWMIAEGWPVSTNCGRHSLLTAPISGFKMAF